MKKHLLFYFYACWMMVGLSTIPHLAHAQVVFGSNPSTPPNSTIVQFNSSSRGLLLPRLLTTQINAIPTAGITGMVVYQVDGVSGYYFYNGKNWEFLSKDGLPEDFNVVENSIDSISVNFGAITTAKIKDGELTGDKINDKTISSGKIKDGDITDTVIKVKSIPLESKIIGTGSSFSDGELFAWSATTNKWEVISLVGGLTYAGGYDASTNAPTLNDSDNSKGVKPGTYYTVEVAGTVSFGAGNTVTLDIGDWALYDKTNQWTRVIIPQAINTVYGRIGNITASKNDYKWNQIEVSNSKINDMVDVDLSTARDGDLITWDATSNKWTAKPEVGSVANPADSTQIRDGAVSSDKLATASIDESKLADAAITSAIIKDGEILNTHIKDAVVESKHIGRNNAKHDQVMIYTTTSGWTTRDFSGSLNFVNSWTPTNNIPTLTNGGAHGVGDLYIVGTSTPAASPVSWISATPQTYTIGDYLIYNGATWDHVIPAVSVQAFRNRQGVVNPSNLDYNWSNLETDPTTGLIKDSEIQDIEDVEIAALQEGQTLLWSATNSRFENGYNLGHPNNPVAGTGIKDKSVRTITYLNSSLTGLDFAANSIGEHNILPNAVTTQKIEDGTINTKDKIDANSVTTPDKLQDNSLDGTHIKNTAVKKNHFRDSSIIAVKIKNGAVDSNKISDGEIEGKHVVANSVVQTNIKDGSLVGTNLKDNIIVEAHILDLGISGEDNIADGALNNSYFGPSSITDAKIMDESVINSKFKSDGIKATHIVGLSVSGENFADNTFTKDHFAANSISTSILDDKTILGENFADASITINKLNTTLGSINSSLLADRIIVSATPTDVINANAVLEVRSSTKGFLPPRMTSSQMLAFSQSTPAPGTAQNGMMVFNSDNKRLYIWNDNTWVSMQNSFTESRVLTTEDEIKAAFIGDELYHGGIKYKVIFFQGKLWLDKNLGASRVPTSPTDADGFGDLYQWGRDEDGHHYRTSGTVISTSGIDPANTDNLFNYPFSPSSRPTWMTFSLIDGDLWNSSGGENNPCPPGWFPPTTGDFNQLRATVSNAATAFSSPLVLPSSGLRTGDAMGAISILNTEHLYWTRNQDPSVTDNQLSVGFLFTTSASRIDIRVEQRRGGAVRCVKD